MSRALEVCETVNEDSEARKVLLDRVGRKAGKIPAELLVGHVMATVPAHEWALRVDALDAVLRRVESARQDKLKVRSRPADGRVLGNYATERARSTLRPYDTLVLSIEPIDARCDCPDFVKNSLGLCKHVLVTIEHIYARPTLLRRAIKQKEWEDAASFAGLRWDPVRPLTGVGDWLDRVTYVGETSAARSPRVARALEWFKPSKNGVAVLKRTWEDRLERRLELVEDLRKLATVKSKAPGDPSLRALLDAERAKLTRVVRQKFAPAEVRKSLEALKRPLYPYQREGVTRFLATGRLLLADDMGLGKTAQAITSCEILYRTGRIRRGLIIAPASLKPQWAREWNVFSDLPIEVVDGSPDERRAFYGSRREGFLIINYEQLLRDLEIVRAWDPDIVVLDEAQRIKNWATKTALSVKGLAPRYRLVLTGTPMENRIDELASVVEWVDDMALEPKWRLSSLHSIRADGRREIVGARNLDTIRNRLAHCMVRRVRQDVLDQLPSRTDTRVPVEMSQAQQDEHDALTQPIIALVHRSHNRPLTQPEFLRLMTLLATQRIISNGLAQLQFEELWPTIRGSRPDESVLRGLFTPKLIELQQLIRQVVLDQGRKVVIFSQWRRMLTLAHWAVGGLLSENGLRSGFFTGAENSRRRTENIVQFHDDRDFRILFATDAGGVGLNLQHAANCVINIELPWNPAVLEQRIGRIYRLGQQNPIDVYNLVSEQGIEARIAALVGTKQALFKGLFDGETDSVQFGEASGFLSKIQKLYEPSAIAAVAATDNQAEAEADRAELVGEDGLVDPFDELMDAADESEDLLAPAGRDGDPGRLPVELAASTPLVRDEPALGSVSGVDRDVPSQVRNIRELFGQVRIRREDCGKVVIEAPGEAASAIAALFEGMAALFEAAAPPRN
jgi:superfamily II DNA or RNA helicase